MSLYSLIRNLLQNITLQVILKYNSYFYFERNSFKNNVIDLIFSDYNFN